jgi:CheY-like chemotaxis protein
MSIIDTGGGTTAGGLGCLPGAPFSPSASLPEDDLLLATVCAIVKRHYGWIESQSQPGQGSTFRIFLPASMAEEPNNQHTGKKIRGGTETVLVVEDEPPVLWITRNILQHHGYHVLEATSGVEALAIWHQHQEEIALLLTDIVMPVGVSGQELAQQFQQQKPSLKVIYTSGYSAAAAANDLKLVSGMNFLKKPYDAERLSATVRSCLDREAA